MNTPSLTSHVVVVDITPDAGRMVIVTLSGGSLSTTEVHRFEHHSDRRSTHSVNHLVTEIIAGLRIVNLELSSAKATVSISACGGDYVCLTPQRDIVSASTYPAQPGKVTCNPRDFFTLTGVQPAPTATAFRLHAHLNSNPEDRSRIDAVLSIPDYIVYQLTGVMGWSRSILSGTGLTQPGSKHWSPEVFNTLGIPQHCVGEPSPDMTVVGPVTVPGLDNFTVVRGGADNNACAVHGLGLVDGEAFISFDADSLVGCVTDDPQLGDTAFAAHFSNDNCTDGHTRLQRVLPGLRLLEHCCAVFANQGRASDVAILTAQAAQHYDPGITIDITAPGISNYPEHIARLLRHHGVDRLGESCDDPALIMRVVIASLARAHATTVANLEQTIQKRITSIRLIGAGAQNTLLCKLTAQACGIPVAAGPRDATPFGSALAQLELCGHDRDALLDIERARTVRTVYTPS